ncbi:MAG: PQQ-dependent sugar dehydrogenase [Actinomycetota bacterium]|nr:PQQ-dependent sugar dehydrogenase [Actinomycetota bacterium]
MRTLSAIAITAVLVLSMVTTALAALPPGGTFTDDDGNVHEGFIEAIAADGITKGCNPPVNDLYCPDGQVTRGQMAAFLVRALGLTDDGGQDWFTDDDGDVFEDDINKLATAGVTKGCNPPANTEYCPFDRVSREQMAAFLVRAYGYTDAGDGDFFTDDDGSIFEPSIDKLAAAGITRGCNPPTNDLFCPGSSVRRDEMASFLGRAEGLTPIVPPPASAPVIETVTSALNRPVFATAPDGDDRLFIVEKGGSIRILEDDSLLTGDFLDIGSLVSGGGEQGLLGMAFHPSYSSNGLFYVSYTDNSGDSRIAEYQVSADADVADAGSARSIITVAQPFSNHNGGMIAFDPSGNLLFGLGDGGDGGDPLGHGQNIDTLLGSMLRIGIDGDDFPSDAGRNYTIPSDNPFVGASGADEIWAYGLRNPWRFSIDEATGQIYIADVGQSSWEEVDVAPVSSPGLNYGWNSFEGNECFDTGGGCSESGKTFPVLEYSHSSGCSITGGYVYRGSDFPDLVGHYFYADYCQGELMSFQYVSGAVGSERNWTSELGEVGFVTGFGVDDGNRLYILNDGGELLRLVPSS